MTIIRNFFLISCLTFLACGCSNQSGNSSKEQKFEIDISPTATGAKLDYFLEKNITNDLDKLSIAKAIQKALENGASGISIKWKNRLTSNEGETIPFPTYKDPEDQYCRKIMLTYIHKGKAKFYSTNGCRQENGQWEISSTKVGRHF